jgi:hypothetical protein
MGGEEIKFWLSIRDHKEKYVLPRPSVRPLAEAKKNPEGLGT